MHTTQKLRYFFLLLGLLFIKAVAVGLLIASGFIGLGPDEAQYWTWSKQLSFGYYSKPPGIAWQIWLGTFLFGENEFGVRSIAVLIGTLLPLVIYRIAESCNLQTRACFWSALVFAFSPLGFMSSFLAITDSGMVLFWALATLAACNGLNKKQSFPYLLIGFLILCASLFKWPAYLFWLFIFGWLFVYRKLSYKHLFGGIFISLLGLLPSLIWNMQFDWPTFQHVFTAIKSDTPDVGTTELFKGNFGDFIGAQAVLLSPVFFGLLLVAMGSAIKNWKELLSPLRFCVAITISLLGFYTLASCFKKMQGNWCDFVYPTAAVLVAWFACERMKRGSRWLIAGALSSITLILFFLLIPLLQSQNIGQKFQVPYKINPFKHNLGWRELTAALKNSGYNPSEDFLFGDKYQISSILSFYGPEQKRAYFLNLQTMRKNQFSYWPGMEDEQLGKTGFFVAAENFTPLPGKGSLSAEQYQKLLEEYFDQVEFLGLFPLFYSYHHVAKGAYLFKCIGYNGKLPPETQSY